MQTKTGNSLLERESALASLRDYATQAQGGSGRLVLIAGEAGVGKSALVEQLRMDLPAVNWWWSACDGLSTPQPLGPLLDLADQLGGDLDDLCQAGADREQLFRALLRQVGQSGTLDVVVIEDVHWADGATLDLLRYLGRRLRDSALLLVVTYRDDALAADGPLRVALGDFASHRCTRRIGLTALSPQAVATLSAGSGLDAIDLHRLTGGNPFYVTEVLRAGAGEVPASARDAVLARAARLGADSRQVLDVAALSGTRVEVRLLELAAGSSVAAIDDLVASGLVTGDAAGFRFRHEIARLAVAQAVPAHRGQLIHRAVLAALRSLDCEDEARLAFHAEAAGDGAAVLRFAPAAARRAARLFSHREAAAQFDRALRFADGAELALRAELHQGFAYEVALLDRWAEAEAAQERALALWCEVGDRQREGDTLRGLSRIKWNMCRGREAVAAARGAVAALAPLGPSADLARAYATFANQRMLYCDHDAAISLARQAQDMAERFGATDVLSEALNTEGSSAASKGLNDWHRPLRRALEVALAAGHEEQAGRAYANLCSIYSERLELAEANRYLDEGLAYCEEHGITTYATCLRGELANMLSRAGKWDDATALNTQLLDQVGSSPGHRLYLLMRVGLMRARRGEPGAWACLDEAAAVADEKEEPPYQVVVRLARAEAYWVADRPDDALREAELAGDVSANCFAWFRGAVAVWLRRTGSPRSVPADIPRQYRALLDGDPEEAARIWTELGVPYEAALALADAPSQEAVREALRILTDLGAAPVCQIVRRRLRALGARSIPAGPREATKADPFRLTVREREVLDLVCAGHTNAEIAAKLFISPKTVGHHVSAILAKLGVPTRSAAARVALSDPTSQLP
jgi:DNA-binding CsgD family transcriptional regulator/tetratricopeptide (TPR) repeat protein